MENKIDIGSDFDGVFRFTNPTKEDFTGFWNSKEYYFPAGKRVPLIIGDETLENIQEIRKRFAYQLATREFYKSPTYTKLSKMGKGLPPTFDEKILEPMIEQCLKPLPVEKMVVKPVKKTVKMKGGSKAITLKDNPNYEFREESDNAKELGAMPDSKPEFLK